MQKPIKISLIILFLICIIIPSITLNSSAEYIHDSESIHEDEYWSVLIPLSDSNSKYTIDIEWTSDQMIDVYLLDSDEFARYKKGQSCITIYMASGTTGHIELKVYSPYDSPYYLVFDNTDYGNVAPAWDMVDNVAYVSYSGNVDSDVEKAVEDAATASCIIFTIIGIVVVVVVIILVIYRFSSHRGPRAGAAQHLCPTCNYSVRYVNEFDKWYCDRCRRYVSYDQRPSYPTARPVNPNVQPKNSIGTQNKPDEVEWHD